MENHAEFKTPIWTNVLVCLLGAVAGIVAIADGVNYFISANGQILNILIGIVYLAFGLAMPVIGLVGLLKGRKNHKALLIGSHSQVLIYSALSVFTSLLLVAIASTITDNQDSAAGEAAATIAKVIIMVSGIFIGVVFIVTAALEGVAIGRIAKGKSFRVVSIVGSVIFLLLQLAGLFSLQGDLSTRILAIVLTVLVALMAIFLIVIAATTTDASEPVKR